MIGSVTERGVKGKMMSEAMDRLAAAINSLIAGIVEKQLGILEIDADNVKGLEDAIDSQLQDFEVESDAVKGLDHAIDERINRKLMNFDVKSIQDLDEWFDEKMKELPVAQPTPPTEAQFIDFLNSPKWQEVIDQKVKESVVKAFTILFQMGNKG